VWGGRLYQVGGSEPRGWEGRSLKKHFVEIADEKKNPYDFFSGGSKKSNRGKPETLRVFRGRGVNECCDCVNNLLILNGGGGGQEKVGPWTTPGW